MGGGSEPLDTKHGHYIGGWGNLGSQTQKGITTYAISANRQRPLAGTLNAAVFNSWRRFKAQAIFVIPPLAGAYLIIDWCTKKNRYYNSKQGRMADFDAAMKATAGGSVRG